MNDVTNMLPRARYDDAIQEETEADIIAHGGANVLGHSGDNVGVPPRSGLDRNHPANNHGLPVHQSSHNNGNNRSSRNGNANHVSSSSANNGQGHQSSGDRIIEERKKNSSLNADNLNALNYNAR